MDLNSAQGGVLAVKLGTGSPLPSRKTRKDFQTLTEIRAREAEVLAKNGNQQGAYYLAGFAVECALKACIAKKTKRHDFPLSAKDANRIYSHDLGELLKLAEIGPQLDRAMKASRALRENWVVVQNWSVDSRYETSGLKGADMNAAVNSAQGVLQWIKRRW
jgi:HEPN domain-containing protein